MTDTRKPLGGKSYGSIPHLPGSRLGPGDHTCHPGQARIATERARDRHDLIVVQEKLDGSNVGIARIDGKIVPLTRAGYVANTSPYRQHHVFYDWVMNHEVFWGYVLEDGERLCGEWLAQAHGTLYRSLPSPFMAFDIVRGTGSAGRLPWDEFERRVAEEGVPYIPAVHVGRPLPIQDAMERIGPAGGYHAFEGPEGAVWRVYRKGQIDFVVKYVRPDKRDGIYLPELSGGNEIPMPSLWMDLLPTWTPVEGRNGD